MSDSVIYSSLALFLILFFYLQVYNSLQDPPSSPLLLKDHNHESYLSDPSFTRTSEVYTFF